MTRELSLTLLTCAATVWAMVMVVGGAWLLIDGWSILTPAVRALAGVLAITAGEFLFMYLVADRWFPRASKAVTWPPEIAASLLLVAGAAWGLLEITRALATGT